MSAVQNALILPAKHEHLNQSQRKPQALHLQNNFYDFHSAHAMFSELHLRIFEIINCRGDACIALVQPVFDDSGRGVPGPYALHYPQIFMTGCQAHLT